MSWPTPAQPRRPPVRSQSKEPRAVDRPSRRQLEVRPACSVYFRRVSAPSSTAMSAKAALQLLAKAAAMSCFP